VEVATGVASEVLIVKVDVDGVPPGVNSDGTRLHLAPRGNPTHVRETGLLKPLIALTETEKVAEPPAATVALVGGATLILKSCTTPACLKATDCMTQFALDVWVAVGPSVPAAGPTKCSTLKPFELAVTVLKIGPAAETIEPTVEPAMTTSPVTVVVIGPAASAVPVPKAPDAASRGDAVSRPLYSSTRTSGEAAGVLNATVTVLATDAWMFLE
jgi:hypothetical protein